jgi:hypothetical protein
MSFTRIALWLLCNVVAALMPAVAGAAPSQLYGKSIVVSWTEQRSQRQPGWSDFRDIAQSGRLSFYVSSRGQLFKRITMGNTAGGSGKVDSVGSGGLAISFQGNSAVATYGREGAAQRVLVKFDSAFASCTADAIHAKREGAAILRTGSMIYRGMTVEIRSVRTVNTSCAIRDGNVFGSE